MPEHFYNTIGERGTELTASNTTAKSQEDLILKIFNDAEDFSEGKGYVSRLTASQVWAWMKIHDTRTLLTSVRRAMSNLCTQDILERTETLRMGLYGKNEHLYKLKK